MNNDFPSRRKVRTVGLVGRIEFLCTHTNQHGLGMSPTSLGKAVGWIETQCTRITSLERLPESYYENSFWDAAIRTEPTTAGARAPTRRYIEIEPIDDPPARDTNLLPVLSIKRVK